MRELIDAEMNHVSGAGAGPPPYEEWDPTKLPDMPPDPPPFPGPMWTGPLL